MSVQLAGPGYRSYAFLIDWHIRVLAALAWLLAAVFAWHISWYSEPNQMLRAWVPAATIYLLYQPVIEIFLHGQSPGKRIAGVRIVTRAGGAPAIGAIAVRNAFRLVDSLPAFYAVGLVSCIVTRDQVRLGDLAAGTLLIVDDGRASRAVDGASA